MQLSPGGCYVEGVIKQVVIFLPISHFISKMMQDMAIATMEDGYKLVCDPSNGSNSNDFERFLN